jgi:hypothetical protein
MADRKNAAKAQKSSHPTQKPVTMQEVQHFLEQQDKSTLIQWILDRTKRDDDWRQQLFANTPSPSSRQP